MSEPGSGQSRHMRDTGMTAKSSKSAKSQKKRDQEEKLQKLVNNKLHEISHFKGEPPEDSYL